MKLDMIRTHLEQCEQAQTPQQAMEAACMAARLLVLRCNDWQSAAQAEDPQKALISMVGVEAAVQTQLKPLTAVQDPTVLAASVQKRLSQIRKDIEETETLYQQLLQDNQAILDEGETLRKKKKELEELQEKRRELTDIKEKQLKELRQKTAAQKKKLKQLEEDYTECEAVYKVVQTELEENLKILAQLPESTGEDTLDALIAQGTQTRETLAAAAESSSEPIRKIIAEVQRLRQLAEGKP